MDYDLDYDELRLLKELRENVDLRDWFGLDIPNLSKYMRMSMKNLNNILNSLVKKGYLKPDLRKFKTGIMPIWTIPNPYIFTDKGRRFKIPKDLNEFKTNIIPFKLKESNSHF